MDPLNTALSYMFVTLFRDALNEYAYAAELAGLNYDLHNTVYGLTVSTLCLMILTTADKHYQNIILHNYRLISITLRVSQNHQY